MAKIKICGLRREEDIRYVNRLMPDYIGFILSGGFRRSVSLPNAAALRDRLNKNIKAVGVFVDEPIDGINTALRTKAIDIVQLHGSETPEYCANISAPVIKVLKPDSFDKIGEYEPYVDFFLFDSGTGTGKTFNWERIPKTSKPFFLAGGLDKNNLRQALSEIHPFAVDMSSSVETDGVKDYDKIKEVINIVRSNDNE